jgi:hypothetical protein
VNDPQPFNWQGEYDRRTPLRRGRGFSRMAKIRAWTLQPGVTRIDGSWGGTGGCLLDGGDGQVLPLEPSSFLLCRSRSRSVLVPFFSFLARPCPSGVFAIVVYSRSSWRPRRTIETCTRSLEAFVASTSSSRRSSTKKVHEA